MSRIAGRGDHALPGRSGDAQGAARTHQQPWRLVIEARVANDRGLRSEVERLLELALAHHHPESARRQRTLELKRTLLGLVSS